MSTRNTARTFYAAGPFFDILKQFGELEIDVQEKTKYCKFKAADILKAIKEGRTPKPGAPGEEVDTTPTVTDQLPTAPTTAPIEEQQFPNFASPAVSELPTAPVAQEFAPPPTTTVPDALPPAYGQNIAQPTFEMPPSPPTHTPEFASAEPTTYVPPPSQHTPSQVRRKGPRTQAEIDDAIECAKFAIAALKVCN